jgi:FAD:protein FMN transferase
MLFGTRTSSPTRSPRPSVVGRRPAADSGWCSREEAIMGTAVSVELWCEDRARGDEAMAAVMADMHRIDQAMSPHKPTSELCCINREAATHAVRLSDEMYELVARAIEFSVLSDGAFDITYASVGHLYDYRAGIKPSDAALAEARAAIGYQHLQLDRANRSLRFARTGVRIDLGGFAKGHAVDRGAAILRRFGMTNAIVTAGGDSHVLGDRRGRPWTIAIADPRRPGEVVAVLPLEDTAISTSGDYERFFIDADGQRCHHLIDPKTGRSPSSVRSVTILADDGLTSEALSKTVFVAGLETGLQLVEAQPGVDAVVVDAAGALHFSAGLLDATVGAARA